MLDIKWIRDHPVAFVKGLHDRGFDAPTATLNRILSLDEERRATIQKLQEAQARRNAASKEIGQAKAKKDEARPRRLMAEVAALKERDPAGRGRREASCDDELRELARHHSQHAAAGRAGRRRASANVELRKVGDAARLRVISRSSISSSARRSA